MSFSLEETQTLRRHRGGRRRLLCPRSFASAPPNSTGCEAKIQGREEAEEEPREKKRTKKKKKKKSFRSRSLLSLASWRTEESRQKNEEEKETERGKTQMEKERERKKAEKLACCLTCCGPRRECCCFRRNSFFFSSDGERECLASVGEIIFTDLAPPVLDPGMVHATGSFLLVFAFVLCVGCMYTLVFSKLAWNEAGGTGEEKEESLGLDPSSSSSAPSSSSSVLQESDLDWLWLRKTISKDFYFCFLFPLSFVSLFFFVHWTWLSLQFFRHS